MGRIDEVLAEMDRRFFGGLKIRFEGGTPKTMTVNTTATQLLSGNPNRVGWAVVNKSSNPGHLDFENSVSTTKGFPVAQNGGTNESKYEEDGRTVQSALFGINETAGGSWYVVAWELTE